MGGTMPLVRSFLGTNLRCAAAVYQNPQGGLASPKAG